MADRRGFRGFWSSSFHVGLPEIFFAEMVYDTAISKIKSNRTRDCELHCCGAGDRFKTNKSIADGEAGVIAEYDRVSVKRFRQLLLTRRMELGRDLKGVVRLGETGLRTKKVAQCHQPKLKMSMGSCLE